MEHKHNSNANELSKYTWIEKACVWDVEIPGLIRLGKRNMFKVEEYINAITEQ